MSTNPIPSRGDVVVVEYPFSSGTSSKRRPALVVQNNLDNGRLTNTVIVMITTRTGLIRLSKV